MNTSDHNLCYELALKWLYKQLKKKRIALGHAEQKRNAGEIEDIKQSIEIIEWIIDVVLKEGV